MTTVVTAFVELGDTVSLMSLSTYIAMQLRHCYTKPRLRFRDLQGLMLLAVVVWPLLRLDGTSMVKPSDNF